MQPLSVKLAGCICDPPCLTAACCLVQNVMRFTQQQKMQMVHARALLLSKMRTILNERHNLVAAAGVS